MTRERMIQINRTVRLEFEGPRKSVSSDDEEDSDDSSGCAQRSGRTWSGPGSTQTSSL